MIDIFFMVLLFISFFSLSAYSFQYEKRDTVFLFIIMVLLVAVMKLNWYFSLASIPFLILPIIFYKRMSYTQLVCFSMFGSILMAYFLLQLFLTYEMAFLLPIAILSILAMCIMAVLAIFEDNLKRYLIYSNAIQLMFVLLDLTIAKLSQKITTLGTIQIFNYTFAGLLFFLTLGILSKDNKRKSISSLQGTFYEDKLNGLFAVIAAISLAGLPGLNIFVSEWLLFKASFLISPVITLFGIFVALLLFIMYFKIINVISVGNFGQSNRPMRYMAYVNGILAVVCLIFGLLPQIQFFILEKVL